MIASPEQAQQLQVIEHRERMLKERLKQNMAKQYDLQKEEGVIRCDLQNLENRRWNMLGGSH